MKTFFIRTLRALRPCASRRHTAIGQMTVASPCKADADTDKLLAQVHALDTATSWPTHRIRNFLTTSQQQRPLR